MLYIIQSILYRQKVLSAHNLYGELKDIINLLPAWDNKPQKWLIANPLKEIVALSNSAVSSEALDYLDSLISKNKTISIVLASEEKDESPVVIWYKNTPAVSPDRYSLTIAIRSLDSLNDRNTFQKIITDISDLKHWTYSYISLETEQYRMEQRSVFEDRLSAGWMLYLPEEISSNEVPSAADIVHFPERKSTLVITKNEFDGKNESDIICANNVEIELSENGHLPKWLDV